MPEFSVRIIGRHDLETEDQDLFGHMVYAFCKAKAAQDEGIYIEWDEGIYAGGYDWKYRTERAMRKAIRGWFAGQEFKDFAKTWTAEKSAMILGGSLNKVLLPKS
jgi:hypothetical protein